MEITKELPRAFKKSGIFHELLILDVEGEMKKYNKTTEPDTISETTKKLIDVLIKGYNLEKQLLREIALDADARKLFLQLCLEAE